MSFLSIAFLAALPLAAAPILLHLFDRRRNVVIEWGAMQFLMEAATRKTSARRLKQWLLLLMRVCAVAALVLAFARPLLPGRWFATDDQGETIFIIDNSMSMMRTTGDERVFDAAVERAVETLHELPAGEFVRVMLASPYPVWATAGSLRVEPGSQQMIEEQLRAVRPTQGRSDLLSALFTAVQAELQPVQQRRRIVLLTDGQASDWSLRDDESWKRFRDVLESAAVPTRLDVIDLEQASQPTSNVAVNGIRSSRIVAGVSQPITLVAQLQNHGATASAACSAKWRIGEDNLYESQVPALDGGAVHDVMWKHSFAETGVYAITCRVDTDDGLAPDNEATVVVEIVDEVPVLVVEGAGDLAEIQQDAYFVQAALGWIHGEPLETRAVHVPTLVDPERLGQADLTDQRAVVIPNLTRIGDEAIPRLEEFVKDGGGLWIALGPRTDVEAFNQRFFADGNGLAPLAIDELVDESDLPVGADGQPQRTTVDPFVGDHPATAELAGRDRLDLGDVAVSQRYRFVPPPAGEQASVLLRLTNGEALAVEKYVGRGRVIVQSVPLRLQWSELARSQAFVVMVQNWLDYLTEPRATRHNLAPGDPIAVELANTATREATLRTPHGDEIELTANDVGDGVVFRSSRTTLPGDYWLELGLSGDRIPFHVHRDPLESDVTPLAAADRERLAQVTGLSRSAASNTLSGTNQNQPLWSTLLIVLIALIGGELLLSGLIARERFGSEPIAETTGHWTAESPESPIVLGAKPPVGANGGTHAATAHQEAETAPE